MSAVLDESIVFGEDNLYSTAKTDNQCLFCDGNNTSDCITHINQELSILGLLRIDHNGSPLSKVVALLNVCHQLLCLHHREVQLRNDSDDSYHRLKSDYRHMQILNSRMTKDIEQRNHSSAVLKDKLQQCEHKNKSLTLKLKANKEEMKRLQSVMQSRDNLQKHVLKKREVECVKLKDRLNRLLSDKPNFPMIEINKPLKKCDGKRGTWRIESSRSEEEWHRFVLSTYEEQQHSLILENRSMRDTLECMHRKLDSILGNGRVDHLDIRTSDSDSDKDSCVSETISQGHFQMPFELVQKDLDRKFTKICKTLQCLLSNKLNLNTQHTCSAPSLSPTSLTPPSNLYGSDTSDVCDMNLRLKLIKQLVKEQEDMITKKQQSLDRCELHPVHTNTFHPIPYTQNKDGVKVIHTTPMFSPTPKGVVATPSTEELYRWMGLITHNDASGDDRSKVSLRRSPKETPSTHGASRHRCLQSYSDEALRSCRPTACRSHSLDGLPSPPRCSDHDDLANIRQTLCHRMSSGDDD